MGGVRGRFAPSPTGPLHFGSLIAALGSFLESKQSNGEWLVRIEDVDTTRAMPGSSDIILRTLERYGLHWDGPVWHQSQRTEFYQAALDCLLWAGLAYPCTCSRRDLAFNPRARNGSPIYSGACRSGIRQPERPRAIRLRVNDAPIIFQDRIRGNFKQNLESAIGDFVIRRADGLFAYQLAVVVDDAAQGINQVVRGCDLLDSTPRQIYLQHLLHLPTPDYAHLPVILDACGEKLSKQTRAKPLDDHNPTPALWAALHVLGQQPPPYLTRESPAIILDWALAHWRLKDIPTGAAIHIPEFPSANSRLPEKTSILALPLPRAG